MRSRVQCAVLTSLAMVSIAAPAIAQALPRWQLVEEMRFGGAGGDPAELRSVVGMAVSATGLLFVLDRDARNLHIYSPSGALVRTLGRDGAGPGEFSNPKGLALAPDGTIWASDDGNNRYSVYSAAGRFLRHVAGKQSPFGPYWDGVFDAHGRLLFRVPAAGRGMPLQRISMTTGKSEMLPYPDCRPPAVRQHPPLYRWPAGGSVAFQPHGLVAIDPAGFAWCAFGSEYMIYRIGLEHGDTAMTISRQSRYVAVTRAEHDSAVREITAYYRKDGKPTNVAQFDALPTVHPVITMLTVDNQHRLWAALTATTSGHTQFDVFDINGGGLGTVDLPVALYHDWAVPPLLVRDGRMYAVVRDDDDVPHVVRYRVEMAGK